MEYIIAAIVVPLDQMDAHSITSSTSVPLELTFIAYHLNMHTFRLIRMIGTFFALLKPNKLAQHYFSYRPISLLCQAVEVQECLLLLQLTSLP